MIPEGFKVTAEYNGRDALTSKVYFGIFEGQRAVLKLVRVANSLSSLKECWILLKLSLPPAILDYGIRGGFFYIVLEECVGSVPEINDPRLESAELIAKLAKVIRDLHSIPASKIFMCDTFRHISNGVDFAGSVKDFFTVHSARIQENIRGSFLSDQTINSLMLIIKTVQDLFNEEEDDLDFCLVHRDVKWSNLIIDEDSNPTLIDYGAAMWGFRELEFGLTYALAFLLNFEGFVEKLVEQYVILVFGDDNTKKVRFYKRLEELRKFYLIWVMGTRIKRGLSDEQEVLKILSELKISQ